MLIYYPVGGKYRKSKGGISKDIPSIETVEKIDKLLVSLLLEVWKTDL